jgi:hypothetical protein
MPSVLPARVLDVTYGGACGARMQVRLLAVDLAIDVIAEVPLPPGVQRSAFRDQVRHTCGRGRLMMRT